MLETETRELNVPAGLQDRVIQAYQGWCIWISRGPDGVAGTANTSGWTRPAANVYVACRTSSARAPKYSTATCASAGGAAIRSGRRDAHLGRICRRGQRVFAERRLWPARRTDQRQFRPARQIYRSTGNLEMVHTARKAGATSNFAGSGGAIVGTYEDEEMFERLVQSMRPLGVSVIRPTICLAIGMISYQPRAVLPSRPHRKGI